MAEQNILRDNKFTDQLKLHCRNIQKNQFNVLHLTTSVKIFNKMLTIKKKYKNTQIYCFIIK